MISIVVLPSFWHVLTGLETAPFPGQAQLGLQQPQNEPVDAFRVLLTYITGAVVVLTTEDTGSHWENEEL